MNPTSEDLQKYLIRGCSLQNIKFKIKCYELHGLGSKTLLAQKELVMKDFLSLFPVRDPEPFKEKHDSSAGAKPNMAWTHISDISHDKRRVMHDKIDHLRKKKSIRIRDQGKRHSRSQSAFGLNDESGKKETGGGGKDTALSTKRSKRSKRSPKTQLLATTVSQQLKQLNQRQGTPFKGEFKEKSSDAFDETFRNHHSQHSQHPEHHMKRKQSAREKLNDYNSAGRNGAPRSTIVAGKRIKVKKWDEAFWKHAAEDPQLR